MTTPPRQYRDWNFGYCKPFARPSYDDAGARRRFDVQETIWLLLGADSEHPDQALEVQLGGRQVRALWLDALGRPVLSYLFTQPPGLPDTELWLEQTRTSDYDHDLPLSEADETFAETFTFRLDGSLHGSRLMPDGTVQQTDGTLTHSQMTANRAHRPGFGDWDALLRRERSSWTASSSAAPT